MLQLLVVISSAVCESGIGGIGGSGQEERRFVEVPESASWAELRIRAGPHDTPRVSAAVPHLRGGCTACLRFLVSTGVAHVANHALR